MDLCASTDFICGWVSTPNGRGTISIIYSSLSTIWLCTWTSLCLNIPARRTRGWRSIVYKFRWQLFAVFFPEVLVALTAEQWASAHQSVAAFHALGNTEWTIRHGFFADMGGIMLAPRGGDMFPVDSYQLAYLIRTRHLRMPRIELDDIRAINKADGLSRIVTMAQATWFCLSCLGRAAFRIGISPLELETLAFILCTIHTFFFWYHKPLDPSRPIIVPVDATLDQLCFPRDPTRYERTPLDFVKPPPDPKSLVAPFWFGFKATIDWLRPQPQKPAQTIPTSTISPANGLGWGLTLYLLLFQIMYYGLHLGVAWTMKFPTRVEFYVYEISNAIDVGLITIFFVGLSLGSHYASFIGRRIFHTKASTVLEVAGMLPRWAKVLVHSPFVIAYLLARLAVLGGVLASLRASPAVIYQDVDWASLLPHV
ncbi:MAG: hypothetical protein M1829_002526 [Trizodia sp. TS-e1964]|nr:MAG: hypothetical protein M1829_002526 [Trizodia sp. TS-e1964]